jgi:beta-phosphoglucomutase-like phosphatase (HAD superfamily)
LPPPSKSPEAVIFDVDGTLYDQRRLRLRMLITLGKTLGPKTLGPHREGWRTLKALRAFRKHRESDAAKGAVATLDFQYDWVARRTRLTPEVVQAAVENWIFRQPLIHLEICRYSGVRRLFNTLRSRGIMIGVFSDYPAAEKLTALGLAADCVVCSTDEGVRRLKPDPRGLLLCCQVLGVKPEKALYIGDRDTVDGGCARRAAVPYLIVPRGPRPAERFFAGLGRCF